MKRVQLIASALFALAMLGSSGCTSTEGYSTSTSSSPYSASPFSSWYDSPMGQQIRMQEAHSRVMRSMIPF